MQNKLHKTNPLN